MAEHKGVPTTHTANVVPVETMAEHKGVPTTHTVVVPVHACRPIRREENDVSDNDVSEPPVVFPVKARRPIRREDYDAGAKSVNEPTVVVPVRPIRREERCMGVQDVIKPSDHGPELSNERQSLAKALQSNIEDLVNNIIFTGSELPDELAQDSCITDEESSEIRNIPNKKDQIRVLISTIKGRDLRVLQRFLYRVEKTNKHVADKIVADYEIYKRTLIKSTACAYCDMINNVNIKYVVDGLWSISAISDSLFADIARSSPSSAEQTKLWMRLIDSLNNSDKELKQNAYKRLVCALSNKNHYKYIGVGIETSIYKYGKLECKCRVKFFPISGSFSGVTTVSPWSSLSDDRPSTETLSQTSESVASDLEEPNATDDEESSYTTGRMARVVEGMTPTLKRLVQMSLTRNRPVRI